MTDRPLADSEILDFVQATLRSVWAVELLLLLRRSSERSWSDEALVKELRSSEVVVREALDRLR